MLTEFYIPPVLESAQTLEDLDDALLVLRLNLGKLEAAWGRAFAPIEARVVPALNTAVRAVTDFVNAAGSVMAALFGGVQLQAAKTVRVTGSAVKRSLADFDQLDRLPTGSGSGSYTVPAQLKAIPGEYQKIADKIKAILEPLRAIDFSAAVSALGDLKNALTPFVRGLFAGLEWLWFQVLTPMAAWSAEQALPVFLGTLSHMVEALGSVLQTARPVFAWFWNDLLRPMGLWAGERLLNALELLGGYFRGLKGIWESLAPLGHALAGVLEFLQNTVLGIAGAFGLWNSQTGTLGGGLVSLENLGATLGETLRLVSVRLESLRQGFANMLGALAPAFRQVANVAVGVVNLAITAIENAVNAMVSALNTIRIDIPKWVPVVGGLSYGMAFQKVSLPRVPALAQGAVLPANKPFLAVVGDQKQGTNVEAPLSLIQDALAQVLGSGQQDTNRLLAEILTAIGAIEVGDDTIGRAARRYENRMAVMGGVV